MLSERALERPAFPALELIRRRWFELLVALCAAAVGAFLLAQLTAWPPHEDETLAFFVGRKSLGGLFSTVLTQRGGAPIHFLLAWIVAHLGGGLTELRFVSALFATASVPLIALLAARLASRREAIVATVIACGSWVLLFHGIYARMYSLFLFASALSFLALLAAMDKGGRRAWTLWVLSAWLMVGCHTYGAFVLAAQGVYVLATRTRLREAVPAFAAVAVLGIPFWRSDLVLANRFGAGVGNGKQLGGPVSTLQYLWRATGDFTAGYRWAVIPILVLAASGLWFLWRRRRRRSALLCVLVVAVPAVVLMLAHTNSDSVAPESRHLIFVLPFFATAIAAGIFGLASLLPRGALLAAAVAIAVAAIVPAEVAWGWHKTPQLYTGESSARVMARQAAAEWIAARAQPNDVLFGYDPEYMQAAQLAPGRVSRLVVPRADAKLAYKTLTNATKPLGHGMWIFDASDSNNLVRQLNIPLVLPVPASNFEAAAFGPFLIVRSREPAVTPQNYLELAVEAEVLGRALDTKYYIAGDSITNLYTVLDAAAMFDADAALTAPAR